MLANSASTLSRFSGFTIRNLLLQKLLSRLLSFLYYKCISRLIAILSKSGKQFTKSVNQVRCFSYFYKKDDLTKLFFENRMKKSRKIIFISLAALISVYFLLLIFPEIFFKHKLEYKSFVLHAHSKPDENIFHVLDTAESLLSHSELYKKQTGKYHLFFCNNFFEYAFFAPTESHAFASNQLFTNNIFFSKSDISKNSIERNGQENNSRTLSGTIAHEVTHCLIKTDLGFIKYLLLDTWKNEGYADFIAKESSFKFIVGMYFICNSQTPSSPSFQYFKYRLYVDYLIKSKKMSFNQIANGKFNLKDLDKQIQKKYCEK